MNVESWLRLECCAAPNRDWLTCSQEHGAWYGAELRLRTGLNQPQKGHAHIFRR